VFNPNVDMVNFENGKHGAQTWFNVKVADVFRTSSRQLGFAWVCFVTNLERPLRQSN
jgi:hypothetical protein